MKRLFVVRHGDTFQAGETVRRIGARTDLPLTRRGEAQAHDLGLWFANRGIAADTVLCGPLRRARRTAELLTAAAGSAAQPTVVRWLTEIDYGPDEGRDECEVVTRVGADALSQWERFAIVPAGWAVDPVAQLAMWREEVARLAAGTSILVTSNGAARFALLALIGETGLHNLKLRTGALGELVIEDGRATLVQWDVRP